MYFYLMAGFRGLPKLFGAGWCGVARRASRKTGKRDRVASMRTQQWEKEKWEWWPAAPEGYKFMSMQHKVASTTSQPIRTPPTLLRPISYHFPDSPFDTGSGVPIDLDRLKTRRNHRRQLLRTPLSGMSCGRIGVGEILAREAFCRVDVEWCLKQRSITKSRSGRKMWRRLRVTACNELDREIDPVCRR